MKKWLGLIFSYLILDNLLFPLLQQEQVAIMEYYLNQGLQLADKDLLELFFSTNTDLYSGLPMWLYGTWIVLSCVFVFHLVKRMNFHAYGATIVVSMYLIGRLIMNGVFASVNYPQSVIPYYLFFFAIIFDHIYNEFSGSTKRSVIMRDILTSAVPILGIVCVGLISTEFPLHPPIPFWSTLLYSIPAALLAYATALIFFRRWFRPQMSASELNQ